MRTVSTSTKSSAVAAEAEITLATNKLIRNTYALLSMTLLFSAFTAWLTVFLNLPHVGVLALIIGYSGLGYLTFFLKDSIWGLVAVFALTGFIGFTAGPSMSTYIDSFSNGAELMMMATGGTGILFLGLSGYALTTRKDFSFLGGFITTALFVVVLAMIGAIIFKMPLSLLALGAIMIVLMSGGILYYTSKMIHGGETNYIMASAAMVLLMSAGILYYTSKMIHGGETNYIMATVGLYIIIFNLFTSLLHLQAKSISL